MPHALEVMMTQMMSNQINDFKSCFKGGRVCQKSSKDKEDTL